MVLKVETLFRHETFFYAKIEKLYLSITYSFNQQNSPNSRFPGRNDKWDGNESTNQQQKRNTSLLNRLLKRKKYYLIDAIKSTTDCSHGENFI